jgi:hypothetical protein
MDLKEVLMLDRQNVATERRKPHNEGLHYLCFLLDAIRVVTSEVSSISRFEKYVEIAVRYAKGRCFVSDMGADRRLLLQSVLNKTFNNIEWINPYPANVKNRVSS